MKQIIYYYNLINLLVRDLLDYGRLNRADLPTEAVHLRPLLESLAKEVEGKVKLTITGGSPVLLAHEPTLAQVLSNLLSNAVKFKRADVEPKIVVAVQNAADPQFVRISVRDNGIGILPQHQERIFKVFERLHGIQEYPGTGIGLAIVKRGVERMGGRLGMESKVGEGSTFWIEIRKAPQENG
jgi:signal transduction histidine kinase